MPAPQTPATAPARPARSTGGRGPAAQLPVYDLPGLDSIVKIRTANCVYDLTEYETLFVSAGDMKMRQQAAKNGADPFALALLACDLLVLTARIDGAVRVIPFSAIVEFKVKPTFGK